MEDSRCRTLALQFKPSLDAVFRLKGAYRAVAKEELFDSLEKILSNMENMCERRLEDIEGRLDKVRDNFLDCNEREVGFRTQNGELKAEIEDLQRQLQDNQRQLQWKDDELFRIIEENSEFKQLVSAVEDLKVTETEYVNNEPDDKPKHGQH